MVIVKIEVNGGVVDGKLTTARLCFSWSIDDHHTARVIMIINVRMEQ